MFRMKSSERARELHRESIVADLHNDFLLTNKLFGYDITKRHENHIPFSPLVNHTDLPRLQEAGVRIIGCGLVCAPWKFAARMRIGQISDQLVYLNKVCDEHPDKIGIAWDAKTLDELMSKGAIAAFPGIEGAHALVGNLENLRNYHRLGVRYMTFAHFSTNEACNSAVGWYQNKDKKGLTEFGRELVRLCNELNIVLDAAHVERQAFMEMCELSATPLIVSHTGLTGAHKHWRNIDDEQILAIKNSGGRKSGGGVVGIMIAPKYLGGSFFRSMRDTADHILHGVKVAGADHIGIGTDLDGWIWTMPYGFSDVTDLPALTDMLLEGGLSEEDIKKILGGNVLRLLREVL